MEGGERNNPGCLNQLIPVNGTETCLVNLKRLVKFSVSLNQLIPVNGTETPLVIMMGLPQACRVSIN